MPGAAYEADLAALALPASFGSRRQMRQLPAAGSGEGGASAGRAAAAAAEAAAAPFARAPAPSSLSRGSHDEHEAGGEEEGASDGGGGGGMDMSAVARALRLPVSHEVPLAGHTKSVTAVAFDPSGARLASGGADYSVRLYDFGGMDRAHRPFREVMPMDGQGVHALAWSTTGDRLLVATGGAKARLYDREGAALVTTVKGDPYITDMVHTTGHTGPLTAAAWHPTQREVALTASRDGSIRTWDLVGGKSSFGELCCADVIKLRSTSRQRVGVTAAAVSADGRFVVGAGDDGSLQLFNLRGAGARYVRADAQAPPGAHAPGDTSAVVLSPDGVRLATRSAADDCVRLWDVRALARGPTATARGLPAASPSANVAWSPDGALLLLGTALTRRGGGGGGAAAPSTAGGDLLVFAVAALEAPTAVAASAALPSQAQHEYASTLAAGVGIVCVAWHAGINQIAAGCSDGASRVLYAPDLSLRGALMSTSRSAKPRGGALSDPTVSINPAALDVLAPHAPELFRDERLPKKRRFADAAAEQLADPRRQPGLPQEQPSYMIKGTKTFTQQYLAAQGVSSEWRSTDPTEALRAYAGRAAESTAWTGRVYEATQPQPLLDARTFEQQEVDEREEVERLMGAGKR